MEEIESTPTSTEVFVEKEKYLEIIGFTSYAYLADKITKYSGMAGGRMRTLGEFVENFIYGKIAEEAFRLFLKSRFDLQILTEVGIADFYSGMYLPDLVAMKIKGDWEPAKFWIDVKEVRRDQKWLLISASSVRRRPYDAYVAVWVGLPDEHFIFLAENVPEVKRKMTKEWVEKVSEVVEKVDKIPCKICGFASWVDVQNVVNTYSGDAPDRKKARADLDEKFGKNGGFYFGGETELFDPDDPSWFGAEVRENVGFSLKRLEKSTNWSEFVSSAVKNQKIIPNVPLPRIKSGALSKRSGLPPKYGKFSDYREAFQTYFEEQLGDIEKRFGGIERTTSWFAQPL